MFLKKLLTSDYWLMRKLFECRTVYGEDPTKGGTRTPYMTALRVAPRRYIHIFWRSDFDPDHHDHPWEFWTYPIWPAKGYYEEVIDVAPKGVKVTFYAGVMYNAGDRIKKIKLVEGRKWSHRQAEYAHRVLYPATIITPFTRNSRMDVEQTMCQGYKDFGAPSADWPIVTYCVKGKPTREWGFHKTREGKSCWVPWKEYVHGTGRKTPC